MLVMWSFRDIETECEMWMDPPLKHTYRHTLVWKLDFKDFTTASKNSSHASEEKQRGSKRGQEAQKFLLLLG